MPEIKVHPAAEIFPMMDAQAFSQLVADIEANGVQTTIKLVGETREEAQLIDGRNRLKAMLQLGMDPHDYADVIHPDDLGDPVQYVLSLNLHRRHLSESQRSMVANKVATLKHGGHSEISIDISTTQSAAAEQLNVGVASVRRARKVSDHAVPEIVDAVERGDVSVSAAAEVADLPQAEQKALAEQGPKAIKEAASKKRHNKATKPTPESAKPEPVKASDKPSGPIKNLRELFDGMERLDDKAVCSFAEWVMKQTDLTTVHNGCAMWIGWSKE